MTGNVWRQCAFGVVSSRVYIALTMGLYSAMVLC